MRGRNSIDCWQKSYRQREQKMKTFNCSIDLKKWGIAQVAEQSEQMRERYAVRKCWTKSSKVLQDVARSPTFTLDEMENHRWVSNATICWRSQVDAELKTDWGGQGTREKTFSSLGERWGWHRPEWLVEVGGRHQILGMLWRWGLPYLQTHSVWNAKERVQSKMTWRFCPEQ